MVETKNIIGVVHFFVSCDRAEANEKRQIEKTVIIINKNKKRW